MSLDLRKMQILEAIIDDYITTGVPVGSRTVSRRDGMGISSATIRNEMYDLKELGFLEQLHSSAGSTPSDKAYRLYVDSIMRKSRLNEDELLYIKEHFSSRIDDATDVMKQTAKVLSDMTSYLSVVMPPQIHAIRLKRVQLVPIMPGSTLLVVVADGGLVRDAIIETPENLSPEILDRISNMLTQKLSNQRLRDVNEKLMLELISELGERKDFLNLVHSLTAAIRKPPAKELQTIEVSGATKLLSFPEYSDVARARDLLMALEEQELLYSILDRATKVEFSITIGGENEDPKMKNCSIVTATYKVGDDPLGSFGVIGPTRMDYAHVLAIMRQMSRSISHILTQLCLDDHD